MKAAELTQTIMASIEDLVIETNQAKISETMARYLTAIGKFHHYSFNNMWLIFFQRPDATRVAGFTTWKNKFGRSVRKGEHGIQILVPCTYGEKPKTKAKDETSVEVIDTEEDTSRCHTIYFKVGYVFDVNQTEGEPLPAEPEWRSRAKDPAIESALSSFAKEKGIKVEITANLPVPGAEGTSEGGKICLLPQSGTRTFIHELAHECFRHCSREVREKTPALIREIEADSVAYAVCAYFNICNEETPNYLALWQATGDEIQSRLGNISLIAKEIIQAVEKYRIVPDEDMEK
jgi:hypothetical protein